MSKNIQEPHLSTNEILEIGREFQNSDRWHGATYDTVKLLCDEIERLRRIECHHIFVRCEECRNHGKCKKERTAFRCYHVKGCFVEVKREDAQ